MKALGTIAVLFATVLIAGDAPDTWQYVAAFLFLIGLGMFVAARFKDGGKE